MRRLILLAISFLASRALSGSVTIGQGIDGGTGQAREQCLVAQNVAPTSGPSGSMTAEWTRQDLEGAILLEGSARAGVGGNFLGAESGLKLTHERKEQVSVYSFSSDMKVVWEKVILGDFKISREAYELFSELPFFYRGAFWKWSKFRKLCGDRYVRAVTLGGRVRIRIDILHESDYVRTEKIKTIILKLLWRKRTKTERTEDLHSSEKFSAIVSVEQEGGDGEEFKKRFGDPVRCSRDDLDRCQEIVAKARDYFENEFSQQRASSFAVIDYETDTYENIPWIYD